MVKKPLFIEDDSDENELLNELENDITVSDGNKVINDNSVEGPEFQTFGKFSVDDNWVEKFNNEIRIPHESYELKLLREDLYDIFVNSDFYEKYAKIKKVPKQDMLRIFLYFYDNIKEKERYTVVEKFLEIADFMFMNYEIMYKELPMIYKQNLIAELDKKYTIFDKRKFHKLF